MLRFLFPLAFALPLSAQDSKATAPQPTEYEGLTFVAAPKPLAKGAVTENWSGFLGPRRDGMSKETKLLKKWSDDGPKLVWSMARGESYASPAVQDSHLVFPHRERNQMHIDCVHASTGRRFWRHTYPSDFRGRYIRDNGARSTPQIEGAYVYVHGVEGVFHCLELASGKVVWKRDLKRELKLEDMFFGVVPSPLIVGDNLILNIGAPKGPSVIALDKRTGKKIWGTGKEWGMSCASPVIANVFGKPRVFVLTGGASRPPTGGLMVIDPKDGKIDFSFPFRSRTAESVTGASPVVVGNRVFLTSGYNTGTVALDIQKNGGFKKAWFRKKFGIEFAAPLPIDGALYMAQGAYGRAGAVVSLDAATGKELSRTDINWDAEVLYKGKTTKVNLSLGAASLMQADGDILCLADGGHLLWLRCTPKKATVLARASLFHALESWTPLVLSRGLLYVCQNKRERFGQKPQPRRLLCYDLRGE